MKQRPRWIAAAVGIGLACLMCLPAGATTLPEEIEVDLSLSPVPAGTMTGGQTVSASPIRVPASTPGVINCSLDNSGDFAGTRSGGQAGGSFRYRALQSCDYPMVELDVYAALSKNGARQDSTGHSTCYTCAEVTTGNESYSCSSCNGVWRLESTHVFTFPAGYFITDYDSGRCTLVSAAQVSCLVKSSKVRL
jgi:hypothetical protein